jgi:hypothetical protein
VTFVEHEDEIEAVAANRADDALGEGIVPGRSRRDDDLRDAHETRPGPREIQVELFEADSF